MSIPPATPHPTPPVATTSPVPAPSPVALTPAEVFHALADAAPRLVLGDASQLDPLVALYTQRVHVDHPLDPLHGAALRSRDDLRRHFAAAPDGRRAGVESLEAAERTVHLTADPEVVVGEFRYVGRNADGAFSLPFIIVLRVRDGQIVESRDYVDHIGLARAFGRLDDLVTALTP